MNKRTREPIMEEVLARGGGMSRIAAALGITIQAVCLWRRVPVERVIAIEELTGIPREHLRPDIYGAPRPRPRRRPIAEAAV